MYYAYSISLMYFLRHTNHSETTENIFDKLSLGESQKKQLRTLLAKPAGTNFSKRDIQKVIEPILGTATRALAASATIKDFNANARSTPLFAAAAYGLEYYFKRELQANKSPLRFLIENNFDLPNFTEAEIYRVSGMKNAMKAFTQNQLLALVEAFEQQWPSREEALRKEGQLSDARSEQFQQGILLDNLIRDKCIQFFTDHQQQHLTEYHDRLATNYVWGSEDTLMVLHRAIQGERMERNKDGRIDTFRDTEINLHLFRDNRSPFHQVGKPVIIMNNLGNAHWTSVIPEALHRTKAVIKPSSALSTDLSTLNAPQTQTIISQTPKVRDDRIVPFTPSVATDIIPDSISDTIKRNRVYLALDNMAAALSNIPYPSQENTVAATLIEILATNVYILDRANQSLESKKEAVQCCLEAIHEAGPNLGKYQSSSTLILNFFSALLDCIPVFLGGNTIRSGLASLGLYREDRRPEITQCCASVLQALSEFTLSNQEAIQDSAPMLAIEPKPTL